jgi:hypothetical protein
MYFPSQIHQRSSNLYSAKTQFTHTVIFSFILLEVLADISNIVIVEYKQNVGQPHLVNPMLPPILTVSSIVRTSF